MAQPRIFLSYRREDSAYVAATISDRLTREFGAGAVFMDVDSIPLGVDFRRHLDAAVGGCDILVAVIGDHWGTGATSGTGLRIDDPTDFVRIEVESALQRDIPVVPVLVGNASMPRGDQLPDALKPLAYRNATEIRPGRDLNADLNRLVDGLHQLLPSVAEPISRPTHTVPSQTEEAAQSRAVITSAENAVPPVESRPPIGWSGLDQRVRASVLIFVLALLLSFLRASINIVGVELLLTVFAALVTRSVRLVALTGAPFFLGQIYAFSTYIGWSSGEARPPLWWVLLVTMLFAMLLSPAAILAKYLAAPEASRRGGAGGPLTLVDAIANSAEAFSRTWPGVKQKR